MIRIGIGCYKGKGVANPKNVTQIIKENNTLSNLKIIRNNITIIIPSWCLNKTNGKIKKIVATKLKSFTEEDRAWLKQRGVEIVATANEAIAISA